MHGILQGQAPAAVVGSGVQTLCCSACSLDPSRCAHCRLPFSPGTECRVRAAQQAAFEEIASQRSMAAEGQRLVREEARHNRESDQMRGGLHALESKGFIGQAHGDGLASGAFNHSARRGGSNKMFSRDEAVAMLKTLVVHYKGTTLPPDVILGHAIRVFQEME